MTGRCEYEVEVLERLTLRQWPDSSSLELRDHVASCDACHSLVIVAEALLEDRLTLEREATPPASGMVWWRMQMRMRREAAAAAAETVTQVQRLAFTLTAALVVVFASIYSVGAHVVSYFAGMDLPSVAMPQISLAMPSLTSASLSTPSLTMLVFMFAAALVFAPVAVYLAFARE